MKTSAAKGSPAFTLVEMLVTVAVLMVLVMLVSQITNSTSNTTSNSTKRLDADSQARLVFSCMAEDFAGMLNRRDVDCFFVKNSQASSSPTGNDSFYFYSASSGYSVSGQKNGAASNLSMVGYRISNHQLQSGSDAALYPDTILERVGAGLDFQTKTSKFPVQLSQVSYLVYSGSLPVQTSTLPYTHGAFIGEGSTWDGNSLTRASLDSSCAALGDGVFRMEFCFQVKDPTKYKNKTFVSPVNPGAQPWTTTDFSSPGASTNNKSISMRNVYSDAQAVVVTLAILDPKSRVIVTPAMLKDGAAALVDGDDPTVASAWVTAINNGTFKTKSKMPQSAVSQVRVYQRVFPLGSN